MRWWIPAVLGIVLLAGCVNEPKFTCGEEARELFRSKGINIDDPSIQRLYINEGYKSCEEAIGFKSEKEKLEQVKVELERMYEAVCEGLIAKDIEKAMIGIDDSDPEYYQTQRQIFEEVILPAMNVTFCKYSDVTVEKKDDLYYVNRTRTLSMVVKGIRETITFKESVIYQKKNDKLVNVASLKQEKVE